MNLMSGGPSDDDEGWLMHPFQEKAHYWMRSAFVHYAWLSDCGLEAETKMRGVYMLEPGNVPRCKNCERSGKWRKA